MNFLSNDFLGDLGQVGGQRGAQLLELGPQHLLYEALGRPDDDALSVHPAVTEWADPITPAERNEQLPRPYVGVSVIKAFGTPEVIF